MDKQQVQNIIRETFESPFDKSRFTGFIKNLLNRFDEGSFIYKSNYITKDADYLNNPAKQSQVKEYEKKSTGWSMTSTT